MKHSLGLAPFLVLTTRSLAFCPPAIRASLSYSTSDSDVTKKTDVCARWSFVWDDASSRCLGESTRSSSWRCRQSSQKGSILMSGVGSTVAPPPRTLVRKCLLDWFRTPHFKNTFPRTMCGVITKRRFKYIRSLPPPV